MSMTLAEYIKKSAEKTPEKEALVFADERVSYSELEMRTNRMARFFLKLGIKKGERIGLLMPNCIENVLFFIAVLKAGAIEVNLGPDTQTDTIIQAFKRVEISALICIKTRVEKVRKIVEAFPETLRVILDTELQSSLNLPNSLITGDMENENPETLPNPGTGADPALIQFTSGTTGEPKGATLTQKSFIYATKARNEILELDENSSILNVLRLSHSCGKSLLFDALILGQVMVLSKGFVPPSAFLKTLVNENITIITGPPFLFEQLLKLKNNQQVMEQLRSSLKFLEIGLAGAHESLYSRLGKAFPWTTIINRYGVTENAGAASIMCYAPDKLHENVGTCGKGTSVSFLETGRTAKSASETSPREICIKGTTLMIGYWDDLKKGRYTDYQNTGFYTSDLAKIDSSGLFYIFGRKDDIINVAGEKVAPKTIEDVILQIPGILEVAAFGIEARHNDQKIGACFYAKNNIVIQDIRQHCASNLPSYMVPHVLKASNKDLPKNQEGKISRKMLREEFYDL